MDDSLEQTRSRIVHVILDELSASQSRDNEGNTILHTAARLGLFRTVAFLLKEGNQDLEALNNEGKTSLEVAERDTNPLMAELFDNAASSAGGRVQKRSPKRSLSNIERRIVARHDPKDAEALLLDLEAELSQISNESQSESAPVRSESPARTNAFGPSISDESIGEILPQKDVIFSESLLQSAGPEDSPSGVDEEVGTLIEKGDRNSNEVQEHRQVPAFVLKRLC